MTTGASQPIRYCLNCATENARSADLCRRCGRRLTKSTEDQVRGSAFVLNELESWRDEQEIAGEQYLRLRDRYLPFVRPQQPVAPPAPPVDVQAPAPVAAGPVAPPVAPAVVRRASPPPAKARPRREGPGWLAEQQANLLLYLGAFLIVIAALVYVGYSGQASYSLNSSFKMALLSTYTLFFLVAGLLCWRSPRVKQAGIVFFALGSLMVPINFVGAYGFFFADEDIDPTGLWLAGSICSALFYAATSYAGFGRWYSIPMIIAAFSSLVAALTLSNAPAEAYPGSFIALSLVITLPYILPLGKASDTFGPFGAIVGNAVVPIALLIAWWLTDFTESDGYECWCIELATRWYFPPTVAIGALFYAAQALSGQGLLKRFEQYLAVVALSISGAAAVAVVYALNVGYEWYGPAVAIVALVYAALSQLNAQAWPGGRSVGSMSLGAMTVSWLCFEGVYKDFPAQGAGVHLAAAGFYLTAARLTKLRLPVFEMPVPQNRRITITAGVALAYVAMLVLGIGVYDVLSATRDATTVETANVVWTFFGVSLAVAGVAATIRFWWPELRLHIFGVAFGMSLFVLLKAANVDGQVTLLLALYGVVALALTLWEREPIGLVLPAGYGFFALLAGWRYYDPNDTYLPVALMGTSIALFAISAALAPVAQRLELRADGLWATVLQALGFVFAFAAPVAAGVRMAMLVNDGVYDRQLDVIETRLFFVSALAVVMLAISGATTRWWWSQMKIPAYAVALVMSGLVLLAAADSQGQVTILLAMFGAVALALTLWERQPLGLTLVAGYAFSSFLAGWRYYEPIDLYLPLAVSGAAGATLALAAGLRPIAGRLGVRAPQREWASVMQVIGFALAIAAPVAGAVRLVVLADDSGFVGDVKFDETSLFQTMAFAVGLVAIAGATTRWWWIELKLPMYAIALAMSAGIVLAATGSVGMTTVLLLGYGSLAIALTIWEQEPLGLSVPAGFGLFGLIAAWAYYQPPDGWLPLAVSAIGVGLFAGRLGLNPAVAKVTGRDLDARWVAMIERLAFFFGAVAPVVGWTRLVSLTNEFGNVGRVHFEVTALYQTSAATVAVLTGLLLARAVLSQRLELAFLGSVLAMVAGLLYIGHFSPENVQAYTAPIGVYVVTMALLALRLRQAPMLLTDIIPFVEVIGAGLIMGPSFVQSLDADAWHYGLILLLEGITFVSIALVQRRIWLLGAATTLVVMDGAHYLFFAGGPTIPNWAILAIAGTAVMAAGTAILFGRENWSAWQKALQVWWYRYDIERSKNGLY